MVTRSGIPDLAATADLAARLMGAINDDNPEVAAIPWRIGTNALRILAALSPPEPTDELIEAMAMRIYDQLPYSERTPPIKPPWIPHGNSLKQDEARRYARAAFRALSLQGGSPHSSGNPDA